MLCHDVNAFTKSPNHLDVIMGASSADIIWFEAFSQKYNRINKNVSSGSMVYYGFGLIDLRVSSMLRPYRTSIGSLDQKIFSWHPIWMVL